MPGKVFGAVIRIVLLATALRKRITGAKGSKEKDGIDVLTLNNSCFCSHENSYSSFSSPESPEALAQAVSRLRHEEKVTLET